MEQHNAWSGVTYVKTALIYDNAVVMQLDTL